MLLLIYIILLDDTYFFQRLIHSLLHRNVFFILLFHLHLITDQCDFFLWSFEKIELFGDNAYSFIGNLMVVYEPVEVLGGDRDIIAHNLSKPTIVGNHEEVDHDDIVEF